MATAKKTTTKKAAKKADYPLKSQAGDAAVYSPAGSMTPAQQAAFPGADLVFAVTFPVNNATGPVISTLAGPGLRPVITDLTRGGGLVGPIQLLPKAGELLQILYPDGTVSSCVSRPRWMWFGLSVTQL
jgi:hypothetical protein